MNEKEYKEALRKLMRTYCCIRPYQGGHLYYLEKFGEKVKQVKLTYPYLGNSYSKILESENKTFIENTIISKIREKDKQIDFTSMYPILGGKRGNHVCKRQNNN